MIPQKSKKVKSKNNIVNINKNVHFEKYLLISMSKYDNIYIDDKDGCNLIHQKNKRRTIVTV